jgi:hypothetical protein
MSRVMPSSEVFMNVVSNSRPRKSPENSDASVAEKPSPASFAAFSSAFGAIIFGMTADALSSEALRANALLATAMA